MTQYDPTATATLRAAVPSVARPCGTWIFSGDPESAVRGIGFVGEIGSMLWVLIASVLLIRSTAD